MRQPGIGRLTCSSHNPGVVINRPSHAATCWVFCLWSISGSSRIQMKTHSLRHEGKSGVVTFLFSISNKHWSIVKLHFQNSSHSLHFNYNTTIPPKASLSNRTCHTCLKRSSFLFNSGPKHCHSLYIELQNTNNWEHYINYLLSSSLQFFFFFQMNQYFIRE